MSIPQILETSSFFDNFFDNFFGVTGVFAAVFAGLFILPQRKQARIRPGMRRGRS
jgi:hypothetical protein